MGFMLLSNGYRRAQEFVLSQSVDTVTGDIGDSQGPVPPQGRCPGAKGSRAPHGKGAEAAWKGPEQGKRDFPTEISGT